jgi:ornithine cyclodeaminase
MKEPIEMKTDPSDKALVPFVSVEDMMTLINDQGLDRCLIELTDTISEDFLRWESFDKTPRVASHSAIGVIELMPTSDGTDYAFKFVNGHPSNALSGLQTVTAFGVLATVDTGYPKLFSEMTLLTALRTAGMSALATRILARPNSKTAAIIGNGAQSEFQIRALTAVCGIRSFWLFDIDDRATQRCMANLAEQGVSLTPCASVEMAVEGADVITTCTADKRYQTILTDNLIGAGVHVNAIGGDCPGKTELHRDILLRSDTLTGLRTMSWQEMDRVSQGMIDGCANYAGNPEVEARCHDCTVSIDRHIDQMIPEVRAHPDHSLLSVQLERTRVHMDA